MALRCTGGTIGGASVSASRRCVANPHAAPAAASRAATAVFGPRTPLRPAGSAAAAASSRAGPSRRAEAGPAAGPGPRDGPPPPRALSTTALTQTPLAASAAPSPSVGGGGPGGPSAGGGEGSGGQGPVRRLVLLRHAQCIEDKSLRDHERPLTDAGRVAARSIAAKLAAEAGGSWAPQLILSSDAVRAAQTLEEMGGAQAAFLRTAAPTSFLGTFYTAPAMDGETAAELRRRVMEAAGGAVSCVMCVGHNRGWEEAAAAFCGSHVELKAANAALLESRGRTWADAFGGAAGPGAGGTAWRLAGVLMP